MYEVEYTDEFAAMWDELPVKWQEAINKVVETLQEHGPNMPTQYSEPIKGSFYNNLKELKVQCQGHPFRILYAFDPRRMAILLIGGDKTGDKHWYDKYIPLAEKLYREHLVEIGLRL